MPPESRPAALGYRWPAEWEPHRATWLAWPHNPETWPGRLAAVVDAFVAMARALVAHEEVCILVRDAALEESARAALRRGGVDPDRGIVFHAVETHDAWTRDHGPTFVVRDTARRRELAIVDLGFDNWGRKYPGWERDAAVPGRLAERLALPRFASERVVEGGAIDGDGEGSILTTESCLLHPNRGPGRTRENLEAELGALLGAERVLWLAGGIEGDDTDGHVDDVARFVAPGRVVAVTCEDPSDPNHAVLAENWRRLGALSDARGRRLERIALPSPPPRREGGQRLPESYANFYIANGVALVPVFGVAADARALAVLGEALPGREIVAVPCSDLVVGLGTVHCLTQQEPA